jgi:hypothetical protein
VSIGHYEFFRHDQLIARHLKVARHGVVMEPANPSANIRNIEVKLVAIITAVKVATPM